MSIHAHHVKEIVNSLKLLYTSNNQNNIIALENKPIPTLPNPITIEVTASLYS